MANAGGRAAHVEHDFGGEGQRARRDRRHTRPGGGLVQMTPLRKAIYRSFENRENRRAQGAEIFQRVQQDRNVLSGKSEQRLPFCVLTISRHQDRGVEIDDVAVLFPIKVAIKTKSSHSSERLSGVARFLSEERQSPHSSPDEERERERERLIDSKFSSADYWYQVM